MIPRGLTSRIERLIGAKVESYRRVEGGYTPALRLLCRTTEAGFFVKIGTMPLTSKSLNREIRVYNCLSGDFMPRLVAWENDDSEPILIFEDLSAQHWAPPWDERQIELTLAQINALHDTPAPLETYAQVHGMHDANWRTVVLNYNEVRTEFLFSYGTLQLAAVQMATFGRQLAGTSDALRGFELVLLEIEDQTVIAISGKAHHTMARFTGRASDVVSGTVFTVTPDEIQNADNYEVAAVKRVAVVLQSGVRAWAYVDAQYAPSDS